MKGFLSADERSSLRAMCGRFGWELGRLGTGYEKLALQHDEFVEALTQRALAAILPSDAQLVGFDIFLLRYRPGDEAPEHLDPAAEGLAHVRLNALVSRGEGGTLILDGRGLELLEGDAVIFRPDLESHAVSPVQGGERLVFSVGCNYRAAPIHQAGGS
jgi:hypothetical protein